MTDAYRDYIARLRAIEKNSDTPEGVATKVPKAPSGTSVTGLPPVSKKNSEGHNVDDIALQHLWRLTTQYRANLIAGGLNPAQAAVHLADWRAACKLDVYAFHALLTRLVADGRVIRLHNYALPTTIGNRNNNID